VRGGFNIPSDGRFQQDHNSHRPAHAPLPRSERIWNLRDPTGSHELDTPLTYADAISRLPPPPPYEDQINWVEADMPELPRILLLPDLLARLDVLPFPASSPDTGPHLPISPLSDSSHTLAIRLLSFRSLKHKTDWVILVLMALCKNLKIRKSLHQTRLEHELHFTLLMAKKFKDI
jgi:hypothetical protein